MVWFIENYVVAPFRDVPLGSLTRFEIQKHLNDLADKFSRSVGVNFRTYIKAILDEALEQDFLGKSHDVPTQRRMKTADSTVLD